MRYFVFLVLIIIIVGNATTPAFAQRPEEEWNDRYIEAREGGRYDEALHYVQLLKDFYERKLSPDDPELAIVLLNAANIYRLTSHTDEAIAIYKRVLAIEERTYGPDHVQVGTTLIMMGVTYGDHGDFAESEAVYKRAIGIAEKSRNPRNIAAALNDLSLVYSQEGRYADAVALAERSLAEVKRTRAPDIEMAAYIDNLGSLYHAVGRESEAKEFLNLGLALTQRALPQVRPLRVAETNVAQALIRLANFDRDRGQFSDAEKLYLQSLNILQKWTGLEHPSIIQPLGDLAQLYRKQGKYAEAEAVYKRVIAIGQKFLAPTSTDLVHALNDLTSVYAKQGRYADALPLIGDSVLAGTATREAALPALFGAQVDDLISSNAAMDNGLNVVQRASASSTGEAVKALNARLAAGNDRLAELVRRDQDLAAESKTLEARLLALVGSQPAQRDAVAEQSARGRLAVIARQRDQLNKVFGNEFPDYASLSHPSALSVRDVQDLLGDDEALIVTSLDAKSYVWAISRERAEWKELAASADEITKQVAALRVQLDPDHPKPFDPQASFALYRELVGPVAEVVNTKKRLSFVLDGALTSLPPQLLVVGDPSGKDLRQVDWLVRHSAVTVLPSVESLKVLRGRTAFAAPQRALIGFADPVFNPDRPAAGVLASVTASRGIQGTVADLATLKTALPQLPDTADELKRIGVAVAANPADLFFGRDATETRVKQSTLDQYRIVYFATHGLLAGDVEKYAKLNAEPALVLSLPQQPSALDDGLLTAGEVAQLKLNAEWVVLSACNTASGDKPGAEALSGLARAFFYAGGRSLLVSNWVVASDSTVALMTGTFAAAADPKLTHAEALQKAMLAMIDNPQNVTWADPKYWAPFVVVGEPAKLH